jgi:phosphoribosylaminoimidazole-succinocarboxamide synthase
LIDRNTILKAIPGALLRTHLPELGERIEGKVRDIYLQEGQRVLITTDRVSAFDQVLGTIPFK